MNELTHMNASEFTLCDVQFSFRITGFEKSQGNYKRIKAKKEEILNPPNLSLKYD